MSQNRRFCAKYASAQSAENAYFGRKSLIFFVSQATPSNSLIHCLKILRESSSTLISSHNFSDIPAKASDFSTVILKEAERAYNSLFLAKILVNIGCQTQDSPSKLLDREIANWVNWSRSKACTFVSEAVQSNLGHGHH